MTSAHKPVDVPMDKVAENVNVPVEVFEVSSDHIVGVELDITSIGIIVILGICCLDDSI